jgi:hypothetical protein
MNTKLLSTRSIPAALVVLSAMLLTVNSAMATNTLVFPQFVNGPDVSVITLINPNTTAIVTGTLSFFNQNGTPRSAQIDGLGAVSSIPAITIPPKGTVSYSTTAVAGQDVSGMARFDSDNSAGGVVRFLFSGSQVGVLSASPQSSGTLLLNTSGGNDTGVAIANPTPDPINVHLNYVNASGQIVEQLDPAELNPLAPNAQVAEFVSNFGFKQTANQNGGTIQIQVTGAGQFSALGLLIKNFQLASTALLRGTASANFAPTFTGNYSGTWTNTTFNSTGGITLSASASTATGTAVINLTMTGNVFGGTGGSASLAGGVNLGVFTATGTSSLFGPATMTVNPDGTFTFTANNVPTGSVATFKMTGTATATGITGNYTVTFRTGGGASGTITMNQGSITMK